MTRETLMTRETPRLRLRMPQESDLDAFADFIDYLEENYVVDEAGWQEFSIGAGALHRTMELVMAYAGELGKGVA